MTLAACAHDEFTNAMGRVSPTVRILRREPFIIMIVAVKNQRGVSGVEVLPEGLNLRIISMFCAGTEKGLMPVCETTGGRMCLQICAQPVLFRRTGLAATDFCALTVQHDDVPRADLVAVIAPARVAGTCAEIRSE